jgi:hypothetical protein
MRYIPSSLSLQCLVLLALVAAPATGQSRDALPVPDLPGFKTLKCDFHMHTVFSDGEVWPTTRVMEAWRDGLDAISITDHAGYNPHKEDVRPDLARDYALARPVAERLGILLIPGVEIAEGDTHCNALFVKDPNVFMGMKLLEALRQARSQGAFVFWNHPGWKETPSWLPIIATAHDEGLIQGVELVNGPDFYPEAYPWIDEKKLTTLANSDIHTPLAPQGSRTTRTITLLFARTADPDGIHEALSARRTAAWMGGQVWGSEPDLRGLWEGSVTPEQQRITFPAGVRQMALRLRNRSAIPFETRAVNPPAWLTVGNAKISPEAVAPMMLTIGRDSPSGVQSVELELEITNFHPGPGRNLRVRLTVQLERP